MIGNIRGILVAKKPPDLLIEVNGIGYEVSAPMTTFYQLPGEQSTISLFTHFVVREDAQQLYGFIDKQDRDLFRALIKVNGVGPRLALAILSTITTSEFIECINQHDSTRLVSVPGIGKKTAERLIIEMRDALAKWQTQTSSTTSVSTDTPYPHNDTINDAISALTSLGYKANEAKRVVDKIYEGQKSTEQLVRQALQCITKGVTS